jgi:hypothetical protein
LVYSILWKRFRGQEREKEAPNALFLVGILVQDRVGKGWRGGWRAATMVLIQIILKKQPQTKWG